MNSRSRSAQVASPRRNIQPPGLLSHTLFQKTGLIITSLPRAGVRGREAGAETEDRELEFPNLSS